MKLRSEKSRWGKSLEDILLEEDDLGLLDGIAIKPKAAQKEDSAVTTFLNLIEFYQRNQRDPDQSNPAEKPLCWQLVGYRTRPDLRAKVLHLDSVGLLKPAVAVTPPEPEEAPGSNVKSLSDIFDDDDLDLLDDIDTSIYAVQHVTPKKDKELPDEIASRKPCEDFFRYEKFFHDIHKVLPTKMVMKERIVQESDAKVGQVFILNGLLCLVDSIIKEDTGESKRENPRLRVIFENGTEIDLLKRSLTRALYKDKHGRRVNFDPNLFANGSISISHKDKPTGYVYILSSETKAPALAQLKAAGKLVKIGYSTQEVHERIKNASKDPTYLEAPVNILASIQCFNLNPQKFENLIHAFLHKQRLGMTLISSKGKAYKPEEWFAVDMNTAVEVCQHIIDGTITQYRMDNTSGKIVQKSN
ncbi:hypothetical protein WCP94_003412 [Bilophila wadsworthia]|uniref:GIY-YIG nuclease family protein n=1 Tax=Bilophila wadsworthia TaxID=35833 RepID=UPI003D6E87D7